MKNNKKLIYITLILIIITIILTIVVNKTSKKNTLIISHYIKQLEATDINLVDNDCDFDHILKYNNIPYFKLSNQTFDKINNEILTNFLLRTCYQDGDIDYDASLNDQILSLAIRISYETEDDLAYLEYKTYNIDTKTLEELTNSDLLNKYDLTLEDVRNTVLNQLADYYDYEKKNGYLTNETFNDYLKILKYEEITMNNMILYIDSKNDLYLYKDYNLTEGMKLDESYVFSVRFKLT